MEGLDSYDNHTKETWRGWQWNRVVERLLPTEFAPVTAREVLRAKTALYLAGPDDKDRPHAVRRGFKNENVIAIDTDSDRIKGVRQAGGLAIGSSLQQVLMHWSVDWPVDVVIADFCGGFTNDAEVFVNCLAASPAVGRHTVLSVNMMRGRDAHSNVYRESLERNLRNMPECMRAFGVKHRGFHWFIRCVVYLQCLECALGGLPIADANNVTLIDPEFLISCWEEMQPAFNSYKSPESGHVFDSIVCKWPLTLAGSAGAKNPGTDKPDFVKLRSQASSKLSSATRRPKNVAAKLAALRAVRTVKQRVTA